MIIDVLNKRPLKLSAGISLALLVSACFSDSEKPAAKKSNGTETVQAPRVDTPSKIKKKAHATLMLGGTDYSFDWVMCAPGPQGSVMVIASDTAKRPEFPMVRASVFPDQPPESVANTMSADFSNAQPRILWLRDQGVIQKTENGVVASGALKGSEMVVQANGNTKPKSLDKNVQQSFHFKADC
ncbi:MAG: hypothetical protein AAGJ73_14630 [Pseudomonadota bacterium]